MEVKVLVTYASKYGATREIAEKIGEVLQERGLDTEVLPVDQVEQVSHYDALILGSAVYSSQWRREATNFLEAHQGELAERPVWLFSSGPAGEGDPEELLDGWNFPPELEPLVSNIQPRDVTVFHGRVDVDNLKIIEKWMLADEQIPTGDYRDWGTITTWAESIAAAVLEEDFPFK